MKNLCWLDTRAHPTRQEQQPSECRMIKQKWQMMSEKIIWSKINKTKSENGMQSSHNKNTYKQMNIKELTEWINQAWIRGKEQAVLWISAELWWKPDKIDRGQLWSRANRAVSGSVPCTETRVWLCLTFSLLSKHTSGPLRCLGFWASSHGSGPSAEHALSQEKVIYRQQYPFTTLNSNN